MLDFSGSFAGIHGHSADGVFGLRRAGQNWQACAWRFRIRGQIGHGNILDDSRLHPNSWEFRRRWYNPGMTLVEAIYELQSPLSDEQLRRLGEFANTYGLRRFRLDDSKKQLSFEYDASRLRDTQVVHALGQAKIAVTRRLN
jgi:hypothetical protein